MKQEDIEKVTTIIMVALKEYCPRNADVFHILTDVTEQFRIIQFIDLLEKSGIVPEHAIPDNLREYYDKMGVDKDGN